MRMLRAYAFRHGMNGDTEDFMQDVWIKAKGTHYLGQTSPKAYFAFIANSVRVDAIRRNERRKEEHVDTNEENESVLDRLPDTHPVNGYEATYAAEVNSMAEGQWLD